VKRAVWKNTNYSFEDFPKPKTLFRRSIYTRKETSNRICSDIEDWWPRKTRGVRNLSRCDCYADCAIEIEGRIFI
jgi:hypothetical protein